MSRMKIANGLFALSAVLFALAFFYRLTHEGRAASVLYFLAQSACIGCAADWFAVSALFKKPLGFPFHTALIPRHRARMIAGIRRMSEEKLLRPALWKHLFETFSLSHWLLDFTQTKSGKKALEILSNRIEKEAISYISSHREGFAKEAKQGAFSAAESMAKKIPEFLTDSSHIEKRLSELLEAAAKFSDTEEAHRRASQALREFTETQKGNPLVAMAISMGETMGLIDYDDMARALCLSAKEKIHSWQSADSEEFLKLSADFQKAADEFLHSKAAEELLRELSLSFAEHLAAEKIGNTWCDALLSEKTGMREAIYGATVQAISACLCDENFASRLDAAARDFLIFGGQKTHTLLGETVETVLSGYDEKRLNRFIYERTEDELGWIRINGAIVATVLGGVTYFCFWFLM